MYSRKLHALGVLILLAAVPACAKDEASSRSDESELEEGGPGVETGSTALVLTSPAFEEGGTIPARHRCANTPSLPLTWSGGPAGTRSYAVIMKDLDYQGGFLHWILYDIPASTTELAEGVPLGYEPATPAGARQAPVLGLGYFGPCSPTTTNTYELTLHAVDVPTLGELTEQSTGGETVSAIEAHSLAQAKLSGESGP